jgi:AraC-like DNA-binding protein
MEMEEEADALQSEMLQIMLKRFLILSLRLLREQDFSLPTDDEHLLLVREFNYLVEKHYKTHTQVSDYAKMMNKSPKTLANTFKKHISESPLQIISQRRLLASKRMLRKSQLSVKEIAFELGFNDLQVFSHFFKKNTETTPTAFRKTAI